MATGFVDESRDLILRMAVTVNELLVAIRLLDRVQILPLNILDQRNLGRGGIIDLSDDRRNGMQSRPLRGPPPPLAGDKLEIISVGTQQHGLEDAALGDRVGELRDRFLVEVDARLGGIGADSADFDLADAFWGAFVLLRFALAAGRADRFVEQRGKATAEAGSSLLVGHAASAGRGSRAISSRARRT